MSIRLTAPRCHRSSRLRDAGLSPVCPLLRDHLDQTDRVKEELASIRAAMIDMGETLDELRDRLADSGNSASAQVQPEPPIPNAVQIETLMLLRASASSQDMRMV